MSPPTASVPGATADIGRSPAPQPSSTPAAPPSPGGDVLRPDPDAATYALRDPRAPARLKGSAHAIDLDIWERFRTVAEGYVQEVWAIGGTVPGPVIRVREGDTVRVHLVNAPPKGSYPTAHPAVSRYSHAVVFHGSTGAVDDQLTPLAPGEERVIELTAGRAGVWMYNGSTEPLLQNITNGMYGMMIVEPRGGLDPVDQELFFVQGEWYLGGVNPRRPPLPSLDKASASAPDPDFVVLNGVADQYLDHPIELEAGRPVRVFLLNAGPNLDSSFEVEGAVVERVIRDGVVLPAGDGDGPDGPAVVLSPGQGAIVELTLPRDGLYPFHASTPDFAGRGAAGLFRAGDEPVD